MASLIFSSLSDTGQTRKNNQDSGYASPRMLIVADGMGGAAAGDLASAIAITQFRKADHLAQGEEMLNTLQDALASANQQIASLVRYDPALDGMGTTVCGAMFDGSQIALIHIGDSRGYLLRNGVLTQLTHDHSWVQSLIDDGRLTPEQAEVHPHRSLILKVLNGQPGNEPDSELREVKIGDRLLFCSDGLSGMIDAHTIAKLLAIKDLDQAAERLVSAANEAGGLDNISVVIGEIIDSDPTADVVEPVTTGAAAEVEIPVLHEHTKPIQANSDSANDPDSESERYAPILTRHRWLGPSLIGLFLLALLGFLSWAGISYTKTKVFIGASGDQVSIYRGVPGSIFGIRLNHLQHVDATKVSDLPKYYQTRVQAGITVANLDTATTTIKELHAKAIRCIAIRKTRQSSSSGTHLITSPATPNSPSASPTTILHPTPSTSASPSALSEQASPYPNSPVDVEGC